MVALQNLRGRYVITTSASLLLEFDVTPDIPRYIHIVPVDRDGHPFRFDPKSRQRARIQDSSVTFQVNRSSVISVKEYCVYAGDAEEIPSDLAQLGKEYFLQIVEGNAAVEYKIRTKVLRGKVQMDRVFLSVLSDREVASDVLYYGYSLEGFSIILPIKEKISRDKKKKFPPFLIPSHCHVHLTGDFGRISNLQLTPVRFFLPKQFRKIKFLANIAAI